MDLQHLLVPPTSRTMLLNAEVIVGNLYSEAQGISYKYKGWKGQRSWIGLVIIFF